MHQDSRRFLIAGVILLVGAGLVQAAQMLRGAEAVYEPDFDAIPMQVGKFKGERLEQNDEIFKYLEAHTMETRVYDDGERAVSLTLIFSTDWRSIHAPTGCYPAQGWSMKENKTVKLQAPANCPHPGQIEARAVYAKKGDAAEVALFVYARPGATTSDWTAHGWNVATGPRGAGGMIVTLRTAPQSDDFDRELRPLVELLQATYPAAVAFWYPKKAS